MNWQDIKVSSDNTHFLFDGKIVFGKQFIEVLKFHSPGLAPVKDESGSYHIDTLGKELYSNRFSRTFGFYCNRAAVTQNNKCFHITEKGEAAYSHLYSWTGNFQENRCAVRNHSNYFHINLDGEKVYSNSFIFCGDFKDGYASVKQSNGLFRHISPDGRFLNDKEYLDLGVFHKNFATAKDKDGWFHISKTGNELYQQRYLAVEPFYNAFALVTQFDNKKIIISETGDKIIGI